LEVWLHIIIIIVVVIVVVVVVVVVVIIIIGLTQHRVQWVTGALSLGVNRPRRAADHSPPSSAEVKDAWSYNSVFQYAFMV
jgi:flagellar basal body-associated protein FliL